MVKNKVEAKNGLENYLYSVKNTLGDAKWADKIKEDEKKTVTEKVEEITKWFESNGESET
jgi:molecular chaperone DnaK (HSP70)